METVHLIGQFNKPPKRDRADERAPPPSGAQALPTPARPPPWQGLRFGCLRYGTEMARAPRYRLVEPVMTN